MQRVSTVKGAAQAAPANSPVIDAKVVRFLVRINPDAVRVSLTPKGRALLAQLDEAEARQKAEAGEAARQNRREDAKCGRRAGR